LHSTHIEIVGAGADSNNRANIRTLDGNGNEWLAGGLTIAANGLTITSGGLTITAGQLVHPYPLISDTSATALDYTTYSGHHSVKASTLKTIITNAAFSGLPSNGGSGYWIEFHGMYGTTYGF